jgi:hypothetical protein
MFWNKKKSGRIGVTKFYLNKVETYTKVRELEVIGKFSYIEVISGLGRKLPERLKWILTKNVEWE